MNEEEIEKTEEEVQEEEEEAGDDEVFWQHSRS